MSQNIYDDSDFFKKYVQKDRQVHGLDGAPEWSSVQAMLPDLSGKRIIDLGCGFGWFCRYAIEQGAKEALGIDISQNMISKAKTFSTNPNITYHISDLEELQLPQTSFDFAYSSLAFHYIQGFGKLVMTIYQALTPGSYFVFTIEHPIFMAPTHPEWITNQDDQRVWPLNQYLVEGKRTTDWLAKGVIKYHRTLSTTLNSLIMTGFTIRHVEEWKPSEEQIRQHSEWAVELDRPSFLLIAAQKDDK